VIKRAELRQTFMEEFVIADVLIHLYSNGANIWGIVDIADS